MNKRLVAVSFLVALVSLGALWIAHYSFTKKNAVPVPQNNFSEGTETKTALLAGGCFWCVESDFEKLLGVVTAVSGYAGGSGDNPTYQNYAALGYREVVEITYDPRQVSYGGLALYLIKHSDPTDGEGSFHDRGLQYAPALYYDNDDEKSSALAMIAEIEAKHIYAKPLAVAVIPRVKFWAAEEYHQDYYKKNPIRYEFYRTGSGRDAFIKKYWGENVGIAAPATRGIDARTPWEQYAKPAPGVIRSMLSEIQYTVTQENGTETPFQNEYDANTADGIYVDILSGEPLYSSLDKYDSGTGWPSFVKPIAPGSVILKEDNSLFSARTEVRSKYADSHLGHVFNDGPKESGGIRYCMNSAALRFIPKEALEKEGYGAYVKLFE